MDAAQGFQGVLRRVGLTDVIQMECLARNSSILEIYNEHVLGRIYIEEGQLVHAAGGDLVGEAPLHKLLSLPGGSFELAQFEAPAQTTLSGPWEFLLMEAARKRDEMSANRPAANRKLIRRRSPRPTVARLAAGGNSDLFRFRRNHLRGGMRRCSRPRRLAAIRDATSRAIRRDPAAGKFDRRNCNLPAGGPSRSPGRRLVFVRVANTLGTHEGLFQQWLAELQLPAGNGCLRRWPTRRQLICSSAEAGCPPEKMEEILAPL